MRLVASVGWLLLVGCNRIFGITATQPWDAPPDAPDPHYVTLTWQLATTSSSGTPVQDPIYPAFARAPRIQIAPLDGPYTPADFFSNDDTRIQIPRDYFDRPDDASPARRWRLEYTLPGDVPHEVQWAPEDKVGYLVVPIVGRLDRLPVPMGSGYTITLNNFTFPNPPPTHNPSVFTTGLWTAGRTKTPVGSVISYDFGNATSLSGDLGSPVAAQGDRGLVVDYVNNPDNDPDIRCNVAVGATMLDPLALGTTGHTVETLAWDTLRQPVTSELPTVRDFGRLSAGLGGLSTPISNQDSQFAFGVVPSTRFPGLIGTSSDFRLPVPVMLPLLTCPQGPNAAGPMDPGLIPKTAQPPALAGFPTVVHVQLVEPRVVAAPSITLYSGMETVLAASAAGTGFMLSFPAAIPTKIMLATPAAGPVDLVGTATSPDQLSIGAPTGPFTLSFTPESTQGSHADYYDVYLHGISNGKLTTDRIYTVTSPEVRIDGSVFSPGVDYVFEIRSYAGNGMASTGDFRSITYPYGSAVVFTRTFKAS